MIFPFLFIFIPYSLLISFSVWFLDQNKIHSFLVTEDSVPPGVEIVSYEWKPQFPALQQREGKVCTTSRHRNLLSLCLSFSRKSLLRRRNASRPGCSHMTEGHKQTHRALCVMFVKFIVGTCVASAERSWKGTGGLVAWGLMLISREDRGTGLQLWPWGLAGDHGPNCWPQI